MSISNIRCNRCKKPTDFFNLSVLFLDIFLYDCCPNGNINPIANLVLGILAQFNSMERSLIRARMESGYNHYRSCGGAVGRKKWYRKSAEQMKEQYVEEIKLLKKGISLNNITKITGTSKNTLLKLKKIIN